MTEINEIMRYVIERKIPASAIAGLRQEVGWNRMEKEFGNPQLKNLFEIGCYEDAELIGYLCVVSNNVTDAYIQDVMVHPKYQGNGIGTKLMEMAISHIKEMEIYMVSVIYGEESLRSFYEKFGFHTMLCGQMETREIE